MAKAKTPKQTPTGVVMRVPKHGRGSLRVGGTNKGGLGRPPSVIRDQLRGSYSERVTFLDRVIDGHVMQRAELPLFLLLPHIACPTCDKKGLKFAAAETGHLVTLDLTVSASVKDRIAALEHQAKYGLGALKEVSVENVRERVAATLGVIRSLCSRENAEQIVNALRPVWA